MKMFTSSVSVQLLQYFQWMLDIFDIWRWHYWKGFRLANTVAKFNVKYQNELLKHKYQYSKLFDQLINQWLSWPLFTSIGSIMLWSNF